MRISFCTDILLDALDYCRNEDPEFCIGFVLGGDANCSVSHWKTAIQEIGGWKTTFQNLSFLEGLHDRKQKEGH